MSGRGTIIVIIVPIQLLLVKLSPRIISADSIYLIWCGLDAVSVDSIYLIGCGLNAVSADSIHLIGCGLDAVSVDSIYLIGCGLNAVSADSIHLIGCDLNAISADSTHFIYKAIPFSFMLVCEKEMMGNCYNKLFSSLSYLSFCKRLPQE